MERKRKFFGDILPEEAFHRKIVPDNPDADLSELMWEAFNGRGKRSAKKVKKSKVTDDYVFDEVDYTKIRPSKRLPREDLNAILEWIGV